MRNMVMAVFMLVGCFLASCGNNEDFLLSNSITNEDEDYLEQIIESNSPSIDADNGDEEMVPKTWK